MIYNFQCKISKHSMDSASPLWGFAVFLCFVSVQIEYLWVISGQTKTTIWRYHLWNFWCLFFTVFEFFFFFKTTKEDGFSGCWALLQWAIEFRASCFLHMNIWTEKKERKWMHLCHKHTTSSTLSCWFLLLLTSCCL